MLRVLQSPARLEKPYDGGVLSSSQWRGGDCSKDRKENLKRRRFRALMAYRSTPILRSGLIPAKLIMGRRMRNIVPAIPSTVEPKWLDLYQVRRRYERGKEYAKQYYDNSEVENSIPWAHAILC